MIELNVAIKDKYYGNSETPVLAKLNFSVKPGEFVAIIGPSGCGKTTLLNMISGLESCVGQHINYRHSLENSDVINNHKGLESDSSKSNGEKNNRTKGECLVNKQPSRIGYIFQQPRLMPWLTVRENIELVLDPTQFNKVEGLLAQVGLAQKGEYFPSQLSGGMQRRVSIARAFAINPQLLLLDEPFNSLDAPTAGRLRKLLIDLCTEKKTTVVFVTHDLQEAIYLADRIIFLSDSPCTMIHESIINLPKPRSESGIAELAFQAKLITQFPFLLSGIID
ncbi:ABC transporter ATP-binding protein [Colwellia sp. 20A7]|uniref:ABC transporter ATP-binding protein n=1 Tax=Colwellia sp. 20A7 TaxID=2689569 RepID=UPI00135BB6AA|nr:ABC transporter ATP-binding protein [Colwellia sp. 20A7]